MKRFFWAFRLCKALFLLSVAKMCTVLLKKKFLWVLSERGDEARDNGYCFFEYLRTAHPEIPAYYVISEKSKDYHKMQKYQEFLIEKDSFNHFRMICKATHLISTHISGYMPYSDVLSWADKTFNLLRRKKRIFLQHGITKDYIPRLCGNRIKVDLFCCGARLEYDYILAKYKHPKNVVKYTGLCRYDRLNDFHTKKQILIMPTWRNYINCDTFEASDYFLHYKGLLTDEHFHSLLEEFGYEAVFYPHYEFQNKIEMFRKLNLPDNIKIAGFDYDVQTLLKESAMMITDYSSVYFDMAYMHKPVVMYQFDWEIFREKHYQKGYLNETDLGYVVYTKNELLDCVKTVLETKCKMASQYIVYAHKFFELHDIHNCERVYKAIMEIEK